MVDHYDRHGREKFQNKFVIYHQGGLDTYCQFYAIFNLINFLHFKRARDEDFIGKNDFIEFLRIRSLKTFEQNFPKAPFGDDEGIDVKVVLDIALKCAGLKAETRIEEDINIPLGDERQNEAWIRIGADNAFEAAHDVLGLVQVHEDQDDLKVGHCVVLIGKNYLANTAIGAGDFDGVVLDSGRDYAYWRYNATGSRLEIARSNEKPKPLYWLSSFVSCSIE
jgi:hypothetical protein